jgi:hypothetical protein
MTTPQGRRLIETHRLAQVRLGSGTVQAVRSVWPLLDVSDLDGSTERWIRAVTVIVAGQRLTSSRLAANYVQALKTIELGASAPAAPVVLAEPVPASKVATSMIVTGPASVKSALRRGVDSSIAMDTAEARSSASAMRHVLNGGRETVTNMIEADPQAIGWQRISSGNACEFCSMLAGRGPVYSTRTVQFHAHDGCGCSAAPIYRQQ